MQIIHSLVSRRQGETFKWFKPGHGSEILTGPLLIGNCYTIRERERGGNPIEEHVQKGNVYWISVPLEALWS